jgi:hypothetical protein
MRCVGLVIGAALLLTACLPAADPWIAPKAVGVGTGHHVGVIGDSLVHQADYGTVSGTSGHYLTDALTNLGFSASTSAAIGAKTPDLFGADNSTFVGFPTPGADIQIIGLGTNDAHNNSVPVGDYETNLRTYIELQPPTTCIGLINIYTGATSWGLDVTAPAYNAALANIAAQHSNVQVIDWNSLALANPTFFNDPTRPHGNATGQAAYRFIIAQAAASCASALNTSTTTTTTTDTSSTTTTTPLVP